jgi:hypothetical protein
MTPQTNMNKLNLFTRETRDAINLLIEVNNTLIQFLHPNILPSTVATECINKTEAVKQKINKIKL